ncbi:hypothetical protein BVX94_02475 [bacterium B17]|nr:hypothetical protein BVX94_02475 [bacterium B17]
MKRRRFLKTSAAVSAAAVALPNLALSSKTASGESIPDLVYVRNGEPGPMTDKAIEALGGMEKFVQKNQTVVVKPNIAWRKIPEDGANTHPMVVKRVVEHCIKAGAKKVLVFDHAVQKEEICWEKSGIGAVVKAAGGTMVTAADEKMYHETDFPKAKYVKKRKVHELVMEADVFIDLAVLKNHTGAKYTAAIKNLMGCVWDRQAYHWNDKKQKNVELHQNIADFMTLRKPDLSIVDGYRVTLRGGPHKAVRADDVFVQKRLYASADPVAVDAMSSYALIESEPKCRKEELRINKPADVDYIKIASDMGMGSMDLDKMAIQKITV